MRIVVDVSNLSIHAKKFIRTGIQEVVYKTLLAMVELRAEFPGHEVVLLPQLPRRFDHLLAGSTTVPYQNPAPFILEGIEELLRLPSREVWGFDLKSKSYELTDQEAFGKIAEADALHIQSMVNVAPMMEKLGAVRSKVAQALNMTIYDLGPVFFPEYCDHGLARWFQGTYLPAIGKYVRNAVCISRHTARDLLGNPSTRAIPRITALPLPFELSGSDEGGALVKSEDVFSKMGLQDRNYLIFLGSLEPRKNFDSVLAGYEAYRTIHPGSSLRLVLVGATGWKNFQTEGKMKASPYGRDIVRAGYLSDDELGILIRQAAGLVMLSQYEGYGLPIAQAFSKGTPVMTTLGSSLPEACKGVGIFVNSYDPWSVAAGIVRIQEVKLRERKTPEAVLEWTWKNYARELLRLSIEDTAGSAVTA